MTEGWSVNVTRQAERDLLQAVAYTRDVLDNLSAASGLVDAFEGCVERLRSFPTLCPLVRDKRLAANGYRWLRMGNRLVFFTLDEERRSVNIERILYAHSDWAEHL